MDNYLGEFPVDIKTHTEFSKYTLADWALLFIGMYGQIDGGHHKQWVIDQVARILNGTPVLVTEARWNYNGKISTEYRFRVDTPTEDYNKWVKEMRGEWIKNDDFEGYEYDYDEGIAP